MSATKKQNKTFNTLGLIRALHQVPQNELEVRVDGTTEKTAFLKIFQIYCENNFSI